MLSSLCVVPLWRNSTFSMHMLTRKDQWVTNNHRQPRQPRFQNQWVAKTIENTNKTKKTKIPEPMGSQSNVEKSKKTRKPRFQNQWVAKNIKKIKNNKQLSFQDQWFGFTSHWYWNLDFCWFVFCFLNGFGYPLILKSWFSCFCHKQTCLFDVTITSCTSVSMILSWPNQSHLSRGHFGSRTETHISCGKSIESLHSGGVRWCVRLVPFQIFLIPARALAARLGKCAEYSLPA